MSSLWGAWRLHQNGDRVRPCEINGQAEYYQWHGERGPITDKEGRRLSDSRSRALLARTPRSAETLQTVINQANDARDSTRRASEITEPPNPSYFEVSSSTGNRENQSQYRTSNSSLQYSAASLPEYQGVQSQGLFSRPDAETTARNLTSPTQRRLTDPKQPFPEEERDRSARKDGEYRSVNNGHTFIDVRGQQVPLISAGAPPPEAKDSTSRNGRTYYYDRHKALIAVAVSTGRPNDRNDRVSETSKQLGSLNLQDEAEKDSADRHTKKPIVAPSERNHPETPHDTNGNHPPRRDDQVDTRDGERHHKNSPRNQRRNSTSSRIPPISKQVVWTKGIKKIAGDGRGQWEELDERYYVHDSQFFCEGQVFSMLWHETDTSEHATEVSEIEGPQYSPGRFKVQIYSTIRRMVVVKKAKGYCLCSPIVTYGRRGLKKDLPKSEVVKHTAVYMDDTEPVVDDDERDKGMTKQPIAVHPAKADQKLLPMSRLNFGKVYAVEHNVKVMDVGTIQKGDELRKLMAYHNITLAS